MTKLGEKTKLWKQSCQASASGIRVVPGLPGSPRRSAWRAVHVCGDAFFAGDGRPGDIQEPLMRMCAMHGLKLLMISSGPASDANWDCTNPKKSFNSVAEPVEEGLINVVLGGQFIGQDTSRCGVDQGR